MKIKSMIPALCAVFAVAGVSAADAKPKKQHRNQQTQSQPMQGGAISVGAGVSSANRRGAEAGALIGSGTTAGTVRCGTAPSTATTFGTGATFTDRRTASGAASTGGTASGAGSVSASSETDVYSSTSRQGSDAGAFGASTADAMEATRRTRC